MKQTAMQDLKEDLEQSLAKINESFDEINNELIRDVVKEAIRITFVEIIKRIDEELLEVEKQQIEKSFNKGFKLAFNGCTTLNLEESQFNEWLEKSKKQRCQHDFVRTSDSFDLTTYCKKCGVNF
jgi:hypothetical protein